MVKLFELLSMKKTSRVLKYFLEQPTKKIYAQQLGKELKMSKKSMLDGLHILTDAELLEREEIGRTKRYRLRRSNPIVRYLKILFTLDKIIPLLKKFKVGEVEIYLYGSAARGEDTEKSDIDLFLIGNMARKDALGKIGKMRKLKPIYFTYIEYSSLARKDKAFYERLERDKIRLI